MVRVDSPSRLWAAFSQSRRGAFDGGLTAGALRVHCGFNCGFDCGFDCGSLGVAEGLTAGRWFDCGSVTSQTRYLPPRFNFVTMPLYFFG